MNVALVIPARYRSSRFPGKPLAPIGGKSMIRRVWERCIQAIEPERVFVATDDDRIADHCRKAGIQSVMTSPDCLTGTDRVFDAAQQIEADLYLNVQSDEPVIEPSDILKILKAGRAHPGEVINGMCPITDEADYLSNPIPKVVARPDGDLLYMSRAPIPSNKQSRFVRAMKQVCIYAFPPESLAAFASVTEKTPLEELEDLEMLRFLELGHKVRMVEVSTSSIAVDFPDDVARVEEMLRKTDGA